MVFLVKELLHNFSIYSIKLFKHYPVALIAKYYLYPFSVHNFNMTFLLQARKWTANLLSLLVLSIIDAYSQDWAKQII